MKLREYTVVLCLFHGALQLALGTQATNGGDMQTGPLEGVDTIRVVNCSWPSANKNLVGITLFDIENEDIFVTVNIEPFTCKTQNVAGRCFAIDNGRVTTLMAIVTGLQEGQMRKFGCKGTFFSDELSDKSVQINVTLSGYKGQEMACAEGMSSGITIPHWGAGLVISLLVGFGLTAAISLACFCLAKRRSASSHTTPEAASVGNERPPYHRQTSNSAPELTNLIPEAATQNTTSTRSLPRDIEGTQNNQQVIEGDSGFVSEDSRIRMAHILGSCDMDSSIQSSFQSAE